MRKTLVCRARPGSVTLTICLAVFLPRAAAARTIAPPAGQQALARTKRVQAIVDLFEARLDMPAAIAVDVVAKNPLLASVGRQPDHPAVFRLSLEADFVDSLSDDELRAVVAHELGHVWIFTHHPYLQTEELANRVALRLTDRADLSRVYQKVWKRTGLEGHLTYLPPVSAVPPGAQPK